MRVTLLRSTKSGPADLSLHHDGLCAEFPFIDCSRLPTSPALLTGSQVGSALALFGQTRGGGWSVQLNLTSEGAERFATMTGVLAQFPINSPNRQLGIVLDGAVNSAPGVSDGVGSEGITGGTASITVGSRR